MKKQWDSKENNVSAKVIGNIQGADQYIVNTLSLSGELNASIVENPRDEHGRGG